MNDMALDATLLGATTVKDTQAVPRDAAAQVPVVDCLLPMHMAAVFQPAAAVFPMRSPLEDISKGLCPRDLPKVSHRLLPSGLLWD
jgi:hypothetical protein